MTTSFKVDAYKEWSRDEVLVALRRMVRVSINKDKLICALAEVASVDKLPTEVATQILEIVARYNEEKQ